jgi:carboxypeptidase C (cathepsin A)
MDAFGEFIRSFLNEYNLWGPPLFLAGEGYGTTRTAGLAGYLTGRDIPLNGVILLSAVFDMNANGCEQRQLATLPFEIMTSHYHKKLAQICRS